MSDDATLESANAHARMVMLTYGRMQDGKTPYWCYVAVIPGEYDRFMEVLKSSRLNLERFEEDGFGEILVSGPGLYPPPEITREVGRAYQVPVKELFKNIDPKALIYKKIEELKQHNEGENNG